jgi:hypothetical protein
MGSANSKKIRNSAGVLERLIKLRDASQHVHIFPELRAQCRYFLKAFLQPLRVSSHPTLIPDQ